MKNDFYVTPEGSLNFGNDSPTPEFLDIEIMYVNPETSMEDTLKDLMEANMHVDENRKERRFFLQNHPNKALWYRDDRSKTSLAS